MLETFAARPKVATCSAGARHRSVDASDGFCAPRRQGLDHTAALARRSHPRGPQKSEPVHRRAIEHGARGTMG